jgi:mannosylfructose-phosphate synthase
VVTTEGGLWQQITWGVEALYANPFDPEEFGYAISCVLRYRRIADQLARYGSHKARANFTWMGIAQQILRILSGFRMGILLDRKSADTEGREQ